jgi:DNA-directed RNA polymerase subunit RPC12/RpoP
MGWKTRKEGSAAQVGSKYQDKQSGSVLGARAGASGRSQQPQTRSVDSMKKPSSYGIYGSGHEAIPSRVSGEIRMVQDPINPQHVAIIGGNYPTVHAMKNSKSATQLYEKRLKAGEMIRYGVKTEKGYIIKSEPRSVYEKRWEKGSLPEMRKRMEAHGFSEAAPDKTLYKCPDCGHTFSSGKFHRRCTNPNCGSLNLERSLGKGRWIKADAAESETRLIHTEGKPGDVHLDKKPKSVTVAAPRDVKVNVKRKKSNPIVFSIGREKGLSLSYERSKKASEVEHPRDAARDPLFRKKAKWSSRSREPPEPERYLVDSN